MRFTRRYFRIFISLFFFCLCFQLYGQERRVTGVVRDKNNEALSYVTIRIEGSSIGTTTDNNGTFSISIPSDKCQLLFSAIGYEERRVDITTTPNRPLEVVLSPTIYKIKEVKIKPGSERYQRKDNPAIALLESTIHNNKATLYNQRDYYSRERYERVEIALNDINSQQIENIKSNQIGYISDYITLSDISGKHILPISSREIVARDCFQKSPNKSRQVIKGTHWVGIEDFLPDEEIKENIKLMMEDVDLFSDNITLIRNQFVSPLSNKASILYQYYIMDTILIEDAPYIDLAFIPNTLQGEGITGHIFISADSTHSIKTVKMEIPYNNSINFVESLHIEQHFKIDNRGINTLTSESITAELSLYRFMNGLYCKREVNYSDYMYDDDVDRRPFLYSTKIIDEQLDTNLDSIFWNRYRDPKKGRTIAGIDNLTKSLRSVPLYHTTERIISYLFSGYIPITDQSKLFYYGPLNTTISYNGLEGIRLRTGGMTTAKLHPHIFANFYVAYGVDDKRLKYMGNIEYSFKAKKDHPNEFPIHSIKARYENDIYQYGQQYLYTNKDNAVLSLKRALDNNIAYIRKGELTYTNELLCGLSMNATLRYRENESSHLLPIREQHADGSITNRAKIRESEIELNLRYAPNEIIRQNKWNRVSLSPEKPIFTLSHTIAQRGLGISDYSYNHTEASYRQRHWIAPMGYMDIVLKGGKIWGNVPYPLMIIPNANLSYTIRKESMELLNPMEFLLKSHVTWDITYNMDGFILNKIPLIKQLKLCEVFTLKGFYGKSGTENSILLPNNAIATHMKQPYIEVGVGIDKIFKVARIDYYRRITYRDIPNTDNWGIRIELHAEF